MALILKQVKHKEKKLQPIALIYLIETITTFSFESILNSKLPLFAINYTCENMR